MGEDLGKGTSLLSEMAPAILMGMAAVESEDVWH